LSVNSNRLFQFFKYSVYALLAFNVYVFWSDEVHAATVQYSGGIPWLEVIGAYAATIDTAAWVVLLLMFELETYVLEDHHYDRIVTWSLHAIRAFCYAFIIYAFYGYITNLTAVYQTDLLAGVIDLCSLAGNDWSYAVGLDEYLQITAANCSSLSDASSFQRFAGIPAVTDAAGLNDIRNLAWVDVINAAVWLLIVLILEIDVWLQERNKLDGALLQASNAFKVVLYSSLFIAAIYWGVKGDFIDFWDALLWLVAFVFIELNVFEWRQEAKEATLQDETSPSS
jgi:hypothetical protein